MHRFIAFLFGMLIAGPILAADKGGPPATVAAALPEPVKDQWTSCYVEGGGGARFVKSGDKIAVGSAGAGCTWHAAGNPVVGGIFARYGFEVDGDHEAAVLAFNQPIVVGARAGYLIQPSTMVYGLAGYAAGKDIDKGLILGAGIETFVTGNMSVALEYHNEFARESVNVHSIGLYGRWRF